MSRHYTVNFAATLISHSGDLNNTDTEIDVDVKSNTNFGALFPIFCTIGKATQSGLIDTSKAYEEAEIVAAPSGQLSLLRENAIAHLGIPTIMAAVDARGIDEIYSQIGGGGSAERAVVQVAHGFEVGDTIACNGNDTYELLDVEPPASSYPDPIESPGERAGVVIDVADADNFTFAPVGPVAGGIVGLTAGTLYYVEASGGYTDAPDASKIVVATLLALNATEAIVVPQPLTLRAGSLGLGFQNGGVIFVDISDGTLKTVPWLHFDGVDLSMGGSNHVTGLGDPTESGHAVPLGWLEDNFQPLDAQLSQIAALTPGDGETIVALGGVWYVGPIMKVGRNFIADGDVGGILYRDGGGVLQTKSFFTFDGTNVALGGTSKVTNAANGTSAQDYVTKAQLDAVAASGGAFSGSRVYNNANQAIGDNTSTYSIPGSVVLFNAERYDTDAFHSTVSNTGRLTVPYTGKYRVGCNISFSNNGTGTRSLWMVLNGTSVIGSAGVAANDANGSSQYTQLNINTEYAFTAGDYIEILAYQVSGGSLDIIASAAAGSPHSEAGAEFWISRIVSNGSEYCRVYNNAPFPLANVTDTPVTFNSERIDPNGLHSTVSNTGRITFPTDGFRTVGASIQYAANSNGARRQSYILLNGSFAIALDCRPPTGGGFVTTYSLVTGWYFSAGDYIELYCYQDSGGSLNLTSDTADGLEFWSMKAG